MRIIAGRLGGRRLAAPRGRGTRPTPDRVREALFGILGPIAGHRVLDLYAGTGALGIEAVSRGAALAVLIENGRQALPVLRQNVRALDIEAQCPVIASSAKLAAKSAASHGPFDLVFADPPYENAIDVLGDLQLLSDSALVVPGGRIVLEHATRTALPSVAMELSTQRSYGDTTLSIFIAGGVDGDEQDNDSPPKT